MITLEHLHRLLLLPHAGQRQADRRATASNAWFDEECLPTGVYERAPEDSGRLKSFEHKPNERAKLVLCTHKKVYKLPQIVLSSLVLTRSARPKRLLT